MGESIDSQARQPGAISFTDHYQRALAVLLVAMFFTGFTVWSFDTGVTPLAPNRWIAAFAGLALPLLIPLRISRVAASMLAFMTLYLGLTAARFIFADATDAAVTQVQYRLFAMTFLAIALIVFADERTHRPARLAIAGCVVLASVLNVYDILNPLTFSRDIGRAAGMYVNANVSGMAIVLGMTLAVGVLHGMTRHVFVAIAGIAVALTQSRSGALVYFIAVLFLASGREIRLMRLVGIVLATVPVGLVVLLATGQLAPIISLVTSGDILEFTRLTSVSGEGSEGDFQSTQTRIEVARHAWETFAEHPLAGGGLGASGYTAHNMYLMHAADHGFMGLFIYPAFVAAFMWPAIVTRRRALIAAGVALLIWGFFSHNVLDEMHTLLGAALAASMARGSADETESDLPTTHSAELA